ncbi:MAG TPA: ATP-binding protein [Candidatus Limnocylindrales bacterium]|nr:ATP-binding protein [Candidatus Limnocylindrales bacterium]
MPTIRQLARLFQAVSGRDLESAEQIASQIAGFEEKKGHHSAAQLLRGSLSPNGIKGHRGVEPISGVLTNGNFLEAALSRGHGLTRLNDAMLRPASRAALEALIDETKHGAYLSSRGIRRRSKLLFVGPPGCGKSFTAQAIANELKLPHYIVRFDAVIGAYLGQTAIHLRELFRFASTNPSVLLFDEIDALGKQRGNPLDVGELDRIVIALMQELEFSETRGLIIATSNLPENLDRALWRRFDLVLEFPKPTRVELAAYTRKTMARFGLKQRFSPRPAPKTYADAEKLVEANARSIALRELRHR